MGVFDEERDTPEVIGLAKLAENVVYRVRGCSDVEILKTLQRTYRDFCRRSCCLVSIRSFMLSHDCVRYAVRPMFGGVVDSVIGVKVDGEHVRERESYDVVAGSPMRISVRQNLLPPRPFVRRDGTELCPHPPVMEVTAVEIPSMMSEEMPEWFANRHGDTIVSGTLAELFGMSNCPWSDPNQSALERMRYEDAIGRAKADFFSGGDGSDGNVGFSVDTSVLV